MTFGPEADFAQHLGMYVPTAKLGLPLERDDTVIMHNEPGTVVALHPGTGSSGVAFMFRTAVQIDHRNAEAAQQLLKKTYRNVGWRTPELLSAYLAADDVYFRQCHQDPHGLLVARPRDLAGRRRFVRVAVWRRLQLCHRGRRDAGRNIDKLSARYPNRPRAV